MWRGGEENRTTHHKLRNGMIKHRIEQMCIHRVGQHVIASLLSGYARCEGRRERRCGDKIVLVPLLLLRRGWEKC